MLISFHPAEHFGFWARRTRPADGLLCLMQMWTWAAALAGLASTGTATAAASSALAPTASAARPTVCCRLGLRVI